jgi:hypothetical protein
MAGAVKYMIDEKGDKTSVIVPIKIWTKMSQDYARLQKKLNLLVGLKSALGEVKEAKKTGKRLQTLKSFLRENNG